MRTEILFNDALCIHLPDDFDFMSEETIKLIYPSCERPNVCFIDEAGDCFFSLSLLKKSLSAAEPPSAAKAIMSMIRSLYPGSIKTDIISTNTREHSTARFSFQTSSESGDMYNTMYVYPLNGQMLLCVTSCPLGDEEAKQQMLDLITGMEVASKEGVT